MSSKGGVWITGTFLLGAAIGLAGCSGESADAGAGDGQPQMTHEQAPTTGKADGIDDSCDVWVAVATHGVAAIAYDFSEEGAVKRCEAELGVKCRALCEYGPNAITWFQTRERSFYPVACATTAYANPTANYNVCALTPTQTSVSGGISRRYRYAWDVQVDERWCMPRTGGNCQGSFDVSEPFVRVTSAEWYGFVTGRFGGLIAPDGTYVDDQRRPDCAMWMSVGYVARKRTGYANDSNPGAPVRMYDITSERAEAACNAISDEPCQTTCTEPTSGCEEGFFLVGDYCEKAEKACAAACNYLDCGCMLDNAACAAAYGNREWNIGTSQIAYENNTLLIKGVYEGTGAQLAGLGSGDRILGVNGESVRELGYIPATNELYGPLCSTARLTVEWRPTHPENPGAQQKIDVLRLPGASFWR